MADKVKTLKLSVIEIDADIQPRAKGLDEATVERYREAVDEGEEFPPLVVYQEAKRFRLSEGFHRAEAYNRAGKKDVECIVRVGGRREARLNACGSNSKHGLPRSNADKRRAVEMVLEDYPTWSNPRIAKCAVVTAEFVRKIRPTEPSEVRQGADGKNQVATKGDIQTKQVTTVATCDEEIPEEKAVSDTETATDPDRSIYRAEMAKQAVEEYGATPDEAVGMADAMVGLRIALEDRVRTGGEPVRTDDVGEIAIAAEPEPVDEGAEFVTAVESLCRDMDQIAARMKALKASRFSYSIHIDSAVSQVEAARKTLWQGRAAHMCPYCKGEPDGCKPCNNTGRVKKNTFDSGTAAVGEAA